MARSLDEYRVEHDVAGQFQQISILLHQYTFEAALEKVPNTPVLAIDVQGVDAIQLPHAVRKVRLRRLRRGWGTPRLSWRPKGP